MGPQLQLLLASFLAGSTLAYDVQPFNITNVVSAADARRMLTLANATRLPSGTEFAGANWTYGIPRDYLSDLRDQWIDTDWSKQLAALNEFKQYTVQIENATIHFVHEKSGQPDAIPIIMGHGWPGSFLEYLPTVPLLKSARKGQQGQFVSFDVVIPSLPGFGFSTPPSTSWTAADTSRVFHTLMVDVLGYKTYSVFGSDWGSSPIYDMYARYPQQVKFAHFAFIPFFPPTTAELKAANVTLSPYEQAGSNRTNEWDVSGNGYFLEQTYQPNTIGLALFDNPLGQLAWLAEKFVVWSDPVGAIVNSTVLAHVSLYYLSRTFVSGVWMYARNAFTTDYDVQAPSAPLGFSAFKYNPAQWPREYIAKVGNLTIYKEHDFGGHFPGLQNPDVLVDDIRELAEYWYY